MLNELYQLSVALEKANITPRNWHKDLKPLPNATEMKPCYKILVDKDTRITAIEPMTDVTCLRKWEPSNGNSFPGFNIQPLYRITDDDKKKFLKKWREGKEPIDANELKKWCTTDTKNWDGKTERKLVSCLVDVPTKLGACCGEITDRFAAMKKLFERVDSWKNDSAFNFFQSVENALWENIERGDGKALLAILIHEGTRAKPPANDRGSVSIFLDVPDWKEYPVAHEKTICWINEHLLQAETSLGPDDGRQTDDAFGLNATGNCEKLPEVKLPVLGGVKLRAMNSESPCQRRYGLVDAESFLIGGKSRKRVKGALEWLRELEREGETWGRVDGKEVLFAYPAILPKSPVKLAACFGAGKADAESERFENYARDVVRSLQGLSPSLKDVELRVFSLRKMDKARTKVVFHRNYSAERLAAAASDWQVGCSNIPSVRIKTWGDKKGECVVVGPEIPFPLQIASCLNRVWKMDGETINEVSSISKTAGIEILLEESAGLRLVPHLLTAALQNSKGLFISLGDSLHRNEILKLNAHNKHKQLMPSILGLFLWKLGIRKECYMTSPPYLVGRILKIADELHVLYCKEVRKGNLPPQLLGNALMVAALDSPTQALAQLALRIAPYLGWAKTNSTESAGLSRYFLKEFSEIETGLRPTTLPSRLDDASKVQVLLGYISSNAQTAETFSN